jgi:hypothetical protein
MDGAAGRQHHHSGTLAAPLAPQCRAGAKATFELAQRQRSIGTISQVGMLNAEQS